jgi:hypothetical protein
MRWHDSGNAEVSVLGRAFRMSEASAIRWRAMARGVGAAVIGRRLLDLTGVWAAPRRPAGRSSSIRWPALTTERQSWHLP